MDERLIQQQEQELTKTGRYYLHVCFMTIPLLCMACFLYGLRPLLLCGAALLTGNLCDRLVSLLRRRVYRAGDFSNESFALIIALLMPATVDWYVVIMAVLAGVLIGKEVFGGYGSYPFNPAAVGYAVAAVSWPEQVFRYPQPYTNIPLWDATGVPVSSTISDTLRSGGSLNIGAISLVLGEYAAPMGTGAALILLACGLFLWLQKDVRLGASVSFVVTCALIAFLFPRQVGVNGVDIALRLQCVRDELLTGAMLFSAVFLLNEPLHLRPSPSGPHPVRCAGGCDHHGLPVLRRVRDGCLLCPAHGQQHFRLDGPHREPPVPADAPPCGRKGGR